MLVTTAVNAALLSRDLDGNATTVEAYYDDVTNLTWLSYADYAIASGINDDGLMTHLEAKRWAFIGLNEAGFGGTDGYGWRLPYTPKSDYDCRDWTVADTCYQGQMAQLYYHSMGNTVSEPPSLSPFDNLQPGYYWSENSHSTLPAPPGGCCSTSRTLAFSMEHGNYRLLEGDNLAYSLAVHEGDVGVAVSAVPVPAAIWLFISGAAGLIGFSQTKRF